MHKQSFAECHSLATKAPLARPSMHFSSKIPEVSKKNSRSFQLKPQEFKQNPRDFNCKSLGFIFL